MSIQSESVKAFIENPIVLSAVTSWFLAQVVKAAIMLLKTNRKNGREVLITIVWRTGGMPSSHAALVSAMTASVGIREGLQSNLFAVIFFTSLIIMRDAMGVRRSSGIQGKSLNSLGRNLEERFGLEYHPIKEVQGHTPLEVIIGALLGIFIAAAYAYL
ncbi:MAG: divergent PAP2 family protein [Treponema sp.]|jgi:acid phosphatase family membrane protein YuiD|nr:divergent PAP2 family protein [Treponema sp.]